MSEEKKKDLHKQAFEEAKEEFKKKRVKEVKELVLKTLEKLEAVKKRKARMEEEERILKLDLEDLRQGNFEKVKERQDKSKVAKDVSVDIPDSLLELTRTITGGNRNDSVTVPYRPYGKDNAMWYVDTQGINNTFLSSQTGSTASGNVSFTLTATSLGWKDMTAGTYNVGDKNFYF